MLNQKHLFLTVKKSTKNTWLSSMANEKGLINQIV